MATEFIITPEFTLNFPALVKMDPGIVVPGDSPEAIQGKMRYRITAVFDENEDLSTLRILAGDAAAEKWPKLRQHPNLNSRDVSVWVPGLRNPLRDASEVNWGGHSYANRWLFRAQTKQPVSYCGRGGRKEVLSAEDFYAGARVRALVNAWAYEFPGNKGVSFGFSALQKVADGDRLDVAEADLDAFPEYEGADVDEFFI